MTINLKVAGATAATIAVRAIQRFGSREAVVDGDRRWTYQELGQAVSRVVQLFKASGFVAGEGIAILSGNRVDVLIAQFASEIIGMRYTPLHPMASVDDHLFMLQDAEISLLVIDAEKYGEHGRKLHEADTKVRSTFTFGTANYGASLDSSSARYAPMKLVVEAESHHLCKLLYTGGTTGRAKGVMLSQRMWLNSNRAMISEYEWPEQIRFLACAPISHANSLAIAPTQLRGGIFYLENGFKADRFLELVEREKITATFLVPTMIYALLDHPRLKEFDLSSLEMILYGAAPIAADRLADALKAFGPVFCQLYGQTEGGPVTYLSKYDHDPQHIHRLRSCGQPVLGIDLKLFDDHDVEVPTGEVGEICVRSLNIMDGYWGLPEQTEQTLRNDWLHTGDLAKMDEEGYVYLVDRKRDMIISGGFNIYPGEIEALLMEHPAVVTCAVIGVPDPKWGEAVTAFVTVREGMTVKEAEFQALVRAKKGSIHTPKSVILVDEMPLTALGKIDKKKLREPHWSDIGRQIA